MSNTNNWSNLTGMLLLLSLFIISLIFCDLRASQKPNTKEVPRILFSTDIANGIISTHGAQGSSSVAFSATAAYQRDDDVAAQDVDDGFTLAMALNLDALGVLEVEAIIPTFGNAPLPAEMAVVRYLTWVMKQRSDIPIVPGAMAHASQTLRATSQWYTGHNVQIQGAVFSRESNCALFYFAAEDSSYPVSKQIPRVQVL